MKITINGSPKELAELLDALGGMENAEKKEELPPLLTELAENEKIDGLAESIQNAGKEIAPQTETAEQDITFASIKPRFDACIKRIKEANSGVLR